MSRLLSSSVALLALTFSARVVPAATGTVTVDFGIDKGPATRLASGFLHAIGPVLPNASLFNGVTVRFVRGSDQQYGGYLPALFDAATYTRVKSTGAEIIVGLYYGHGSYWPGDSGDNYAKWETEVQGVLDESKSKRYGVYSWITWNEPNLQWAGKIPQYKEAHRRAYNKVKAWDPSARVEAPEISSFNFAFLTDFLTYCKANNVVPDIISWHELLATPADIEGHTAQLKNWLAMNGIPPRPFAITEYQGDDYGASAASGYYDPGLAVAYIARLERSAANGLEIACRANWSWLGSDSNFKADLAGLADRATCASPTSIWWLYSAYNQMTGTKATTTQSSGLEAFATMDSAKREARALVGNWSDSTAHTVTLNLNGLPAYVRQGTSVHVRAWTVSQTVGTPLSNMVVVEDTMHAISGSSAVTLTPTLPSDTALIVQVGPGSGAGGGGGSAGAGGSATGGSAGRGGSGAGGSAGSAGRTGAAGSGGGTGGRSSGSGGGAAGTLGTGGARVIGTGGDGTGGGGSGTGGGGTGGSAGTGGSPTTGGSPGQGGSGAAGGAGPTNPTGSSSGCSCQSGGEKTPSPALLGLFALLAFRALRKRRRSGAR